MTKKKILSFPNQVFTFAVCIMIGVKTVIRLHTRKCDKTPENQVHDCNGHPTVHIKFLLQHLKKLLLKLNLQPKKVKVIPNKNYAFVTFK